MKEVIINKRIETHIKRKYGKSTTRAEIVKVHPTQSTHWIFSTK